ncbi:MAG: DUF1080 domain-containing protein [Acidobacteriota bacterium]
MKVQLAGKDSLIRLVLVPALMVGTLFVMEGRSQIKPPDVAPKVVDAGPIGGPPADAIILFNGKDLSQWKSANAGEAKWLVKDGAMEVVAKTGDIVSKPEFGDMQLHVEWATPAVVQGTSQGRGNSGIFLQGIYEVQVLDSFNNTTYFHGQAGAVYKQYAPLVNASRKPGEWQAYDIIYHAPKFDDAGKVLKKARVTVLHNGVLIQDDVEILGTTTHEEVQPTYTKHPDKGPIRLQDHGNPIRFRNIWVRPLGSK